MFKIMVIYPLGRGVGRTVGHGTASARRAALTFVVALVVALTAVGCSSERTPSPEPEGAGRPPVVVAAGNIGDCRSADDEATAELVRDIIEGTVLALGDEAPPRGTAAHFEECYEPSWGPFKWRTRPVPGDLEYYTEGAAGYFDYFGEAAGDPDEGYYSYNLDGWHIVALNSNCQEVGGCLDDSPQFQWLKEDLIANDEKACTLAYFHHPLFTSGSHRPGFLNVRPLWRVLHSAGADVVLAAHVHNYQRFAPQDPTGKADPQRGIREFVVGTGGQKNYAIAGDPIANSEVHNDDTKGVLKLTLRPKGYEWRFIPVEGEAFTDSGSARCH
jgi:acid phosphatase type 7